ncbi:MAG: DUF421 domain-containing protein [Armatimonadetes bacterium]|nr:DUF421 domain-containing protein [Armatimonadota bacterium]
MGSIDWHGMFVPHQSMVEVVIRGTILYFFIFTMLRVIVKRNLGALGTTDLLVITLIADAAQNGMAGDYKSVPEGLVLCATIIGWSQLIEWLSSRSSRFQRLLEPAPVDLVQHGVMMRRNMRREMITVEELMSQIRLAGLDEISSVKRAVMESDGRVSVIAYPSSTPPNPSSPSNFA